MGVFYDSELFLDDAREEAATARVMLEQRDYTAARAYAAVADALASVVGISLVADQDRRTRELLLGVEPGEVARPEPAATLADQVAAGTASPIVMDAHADRFTDPAEKTQRRGR